MIVFCTLLYILLLWLLIRFKVVPDSKMVWLTLVPFELVLLLGFFIPMQWGAPAGDVRAMAYAISMTPNVTGQVIEVPVRGNDRVKEGDVLYRIDPTQYQAAYDGLQAQLSLAQTRLNQSRELASADAGSVYEVQAYQAQVNGLQAQVSNAKWNLDQTVVRAPTDGVITNLALRVGQRVSNLPLYRAMSFTDTSEIILVSQVPQNYARYIESEQPAEVTFKSIPGKVFSGKVMFLIEATAQGQIQNTGVAPSPEGSTPGPFFVRIQLDDPDLQLGLIPGSIGSTAIYTDKVTVAHVIRKVMIRMDAIINYVDPR